MGGTGKHYAMWNKPGSERQIPYGLPLSGTWSTRWTSKQNITRDIEIKNKLTVMRGEVRGDNRGKRKKGFQEHI